MKQFRTMTGIAFGMVLMAGLLGYGPRYVQANDQAKSRNPVERFLKQGRKHSIPYDQIHHGGPPVDGIPSLDRPAMVPVEKMDRLKPNDRMLVVRVNETTVGYPIRILNYHELVNDVVAGRPVLITWCPLCGSGVVFDRRVDGETLTFGVSGLLYQSDVLFYDRQTDSLWSQLEAKAVVGPKTGTSLKQVPHSSMTWSRFKQQFSGGRVLSFNTGYDRNYSVDPYTRYRQRSTVMFPVNNQDRRLSNKAPVIGIERPKHAVAYPVSDLKKRSHVVDRLGNQSIVLVNHGGAIRAYEISNSAAKKLAATDSPPVKQGWTVTTDKLTSPSGRQFPRIHHVNSYWFAWATFHPGTKLWRGRSP